MMTWIRSCAPSAHEERLMIDIAIVGADGRMGRRLVALAPEHQCRVVAAITRRHSDLPESVRILIDFSTPAATRQWLQTCRQRRIPIVIGTTGLEKADQAAIDHAAGEIPILQAANMGLGVAVLARLAKQAAALLEGCQIQITETHHAMKKDAPSGTALSLAAAIAPDGAIPIVSHRLGDEIGRHEVSFTMTGERLELTHIATDRDPFAHGALRAAEWLSRQKPGRYSINDVLKW
jgi:4-hydroxy-tetrahydrodipicolinate reductase